MDTPATTFSAGTTAVNSVAPTAVHTRRNSFHFEKRIDTLDPIDIAKDLEKGLREAVAAVAHKRAEEEKDRSWTLLVACTLIVALTQGWGFVFGVFQPWFKQHALSATMSDSLLVLLPTTQAMSMMITCSISGRLGDRYGPKPFICLGCLASVISILGCAFGSHLRQLFASQAAQGIGAGLVFPPCGAIVTRSWQSRARFANAAVVAAVPAYAFIAVLVSRAMLTRVGHHTTLLIVCGVHAAIFIPCLVVIYRAPSPNRTETITWIDTTLVKDRRFWCLALSISATALALLPPFVFITVYTVKNVPQISLQLSVLPLALLNLSACFGRIAAALLLERFPKATRRLFFAVILVSALTQLIWATSRGSFAVIVLYAVANGFVGGTFMTLLPPLVVGLFPEVNKTVGVGSLTIFAAPGCFFGALIFNKVLHITQFNWQMSILGAGVCQLVGAGFALFI